MAVIGFHSKYFDKVVKEVANENDISNVRVVFKNGVENGINFIGIIHRFTIEGIKNGEPVQLHIIGKVITDSEVRREVMSLNTFAQREFFAYKVIFPGLDAIASECNFRINRPICYKAGADKLKEFIFMEDLSVKGYEQCRLGKSLDFDHTVLLLEQMACLHAQMFVYKHKHPKHFVNMCEGLTDILFTKVGNIDKTVAVALQYAKEHGCCEESEDIFKAYEKHDIVKKNIFLLDGNNDKYSIICHGDLWAGNLMFHCKDNKPDAVMLLDWQCIRYSSPVTDLFFAIFITVNADLRKEKFQELLDMYYEALAVQITALKGDPQVLFPENIYREHLIKYSYAGFSSALIMLTIFHGSGEMPSEENIKEWSEKNGAVMANDHPTDDYIKKMTQTIKDIKYNELHTSW